jgi:hypothetical protein
MTDTLARPAPAPAPASGGGGWRRHKLTAILVVAFVAAVGVALWSGGGARTTTPLDPDNPGPDGAQALAQVLGDEGVDVEVARNLADLEKVDAGGDLTVVVTSTDYLGRRVIDRMLDHVGDARVVLVEPGEGVLDALGYDFHSVNAVADDDRWSADCTDPLVEGLTLEVDSSLTYEAPGCFTDDDRSVLVERDNVTLFGAGDALTNDQVVRGDNAAVTLRLLGQTERLVWFVPSYDDLSAGDGVSAETLLPRWIRPGLWLGAIIVLVVIAWRVRRLGPLATEPLPVVVKAIETTRSRGRLYRKAGDRAHAAAGLRAATRTRTAERLRLGASAGTFVGEAALIRDVARHVGRPEADIALILGSHGPTPGSDKDLISLATDLAALEEEVRRT